MLLQPYDWILRFTLVILVLFIILLLLRPLWKLTSTRSALIIVFSRAVGNLLRLLADLPIFINYDIFKNANIFPEYFFTINNANVRTLQTMQIVHILTLAINRVHALFFPFHYNFFAAKKRYFYWICLFLWLLSTIIGYFETLQVQIYIFNIQHQLPYSTPFPIGYYFNNSANFFAALCYIAVGCRLIWIKIKKNNDDILSNIHIEKDLLRIFLVCLSCLIVSCFRIALLDRLSEIAYNQRWPDLPKTIHYWINYAFYLIGFCTEEISLAILIPDFRKNIAKQFCTIFCCKKSNGIDLKQQKQQQNNNIPETSIKINNFIVGT